MSAEIRRQSVVLTPLCVAAPATGETAQHLNAMLDELRWFYEHGMKLSVNPNNTGNGWTLIFDESNAGGIAE